MKRKKYNCLILFFALCISCDNPEKQYSNALTGEWQIEKLLHGNKDYSSNDTYIMSFDSPNKLWIRNMNHDKEISVNSNFEVSRNSGGYVMDIKDCNDKNINGNYNIYIDTIQDDGESYLIRLTLDSEKTYIQAIRPKLKYYLPN